MISLQHFYALLPPERLEALACHYQLDRAHSVKLSGPAVFLCVLGGLLSHNELSQRLLEETYRRQTGQTVDHSSFGKCLAQIEPAFFAHLFTELYHRLAPQVSAGEARALRLRFVDATTVTLSAKLLHFGLLVGTRAPDKSHRHVKSVLELSAEGWPHLLHVCSTPRENSDSVALGESMQLHSQPGDVWIFDKGVHGRERLWAIAEQRAFFLTPHSLQGLAVQKVLWQSSTPPPSQPPGRGEADSLVVRVEQAVFANSAQTAAMRAKWEQMPLVLVHLLRYDTRSRTWKPLTLMTNLALSEDALRAGPYTFVELAALYRKRWDIEVFFKCLKQHLSYSHLTSRSENGIRVMIYMSLIAVLFLLWYKRQTGLDRGWRSVKFWLAEDVRTWIQDLLNTEVVVLDTG